MTAHISRYMNSSHCCCHCSLCRSFATKANYFTIVRDCSWIKIYTYSIYCRISKLYMYCIAVENILEKWDLGFVYFITFCLLSRSLSLSSQVHGRLSIQWLSDQSSVSFFFRSSYEPKGFIVLSWVPMLLFVCLPWKLFHFLVRLPNSNDKRFFLCLHES